MTVIYLPVNYHVFCGRDGHSGACSRDPLGAILNWLLGATGVL